MAGAGGGGRSGFRRGLRPRPSLGEGPCASGCAGAGVGGGVGPGGLRLPRGELGYGRRAWDATLGPICQGDRARGLSLLFVLKENSLRELLVFFFF